MRMTLRHYVCSTRWKSRRCPESQKVLSYTEPADQANEFELIPTVRMESQHSIGVPTSHDFPRFAIISEKSRLEVRNRWRWSRYGFFWKKRPLKGKFSKNYSKRIHHVTESRLVCKFCEIWLTGNQQSRALFTWQKNKTSARSPTLASARITPKIC